MEPAYQAVYEDLYRNHWWWRAREALILDHIRRLRPTRKTETILDVGCGNGLLFDPLETWGNIEGVEPAAEMVDPRSRHAAKIHIRPFDSSFQTGKKYSLILMLDILEHLDAPAEALRHSLTLLEPDGFVLITVPAFPALWTQHDVYNHHRTRYTKTSFNSLAALAGLKITKEHYFFHWCFPIVLAAHYLEAFAKKPPQVPRVPPRWLNQTLYFLSRAEQRLFRAAPLPFGTSLLIVGQNA